MGKESRSATATLSGGDRPGAEGAQCPNMHGPVTGACTLDVQARWRRTRCGGVDSERGRSTHGEEDIVRDLDGPRDAEELVRELGELLGRHGGSEAANRQGGAGEADGGFPRTA